MNLVGNLKLKSVNLKPKTVNELLDKAGLPFGLKAGMFGNIEVSVSSLYIVQFALILE